MKLTTVLLIVTMMQVSAASMAQRITFKDKHTTLKQLFKELKKQTGYDVLWTTDKIKESKTIDADFKNASLDEVMKRVLRDQSLMYQIDEKTIIIKETAASLLDKIKSPNVVPIVVSGKITDELGNPLTGVTISVQGTGFGAIADDKGMYKIEVEPGKTLVFSYLGFVAQLYLIKDQTVINVAMIRKFTALQEVVINKGYYTEDQKTTTGDATTVKSDDILKTPSTNPILALEGRVPGLFIQTNSGLPGATQLIRERGSLTNGTDPLYVINGVPYISQTLSIVGSPSNGGRGIATPSGLSPLADLNPTDIEEITVLKDADATAIYGSRGANGVILITTRKGKAGQTKTSFDVSSAFSQYEKFTDLLNTQQHLDMRREAFRNDGTTPTSSNYDINGV